MCSTCPPIIIGKESGSKIIWHRPDCLNWSCPECRPKREAMWIEQMTMNWSGLSTIYFDVIESDAWEAYRKKVIRRGGRYAKVIGLDGIFYVFTDVQVGASVNLSVDKAIEKFGWCVKSAKAPKGRSGGHVVATSRSWKLLKAIKLFDDFERIAVGVEKKEVERVLDELGQSHETKQFSEHVKVDALVSVLDSPKTYQTFKAKIEEIVLAKKVRASRPIFYSPEGLCLDSIPYTTKKERGNDGQTSMEREHRRSEAGRCGVC